MHILFLKSLVSYKRARRRHTATGGRSRVSETTGSSRSTLEHAESCASSTSVRGRRAFCFSKFARDRLEKVEFQVDEKNDDIGGTRDAPVTFPLSATSSRGIGIPSGRIIIPILPRFGGISRVSFERDNLMKHIKLRHQIIAAKWEEQEGLWHVRIHDEEQGREFTDTCNVLVNGGGILNNWKWPDIAGLHSFQGVLQHSAHYTEGLDLKAAGSKIVVKIASEVDHLYTWVRSPTWITAGFAQKFASNGGGNFEYTPIQKQLFKENPKLYLKYSKMIESELKQRFKFILKNTPESKAAKEYAIAEMKQKLADNLESMEKMIPKDFDVDCQRPTLMHVLSSVLDFWPYAVIQPGNGFLEALNRENVTVFTKLMTTVTSKGFIDHTGQEHEVDIIICATGRSFDTTWIPRFPVEANGTSLAKLWRNEAPSYLSVAPPSIPNYYMMGGPYRPLGYGSFLPILEILARYIIQIIDKMQTDRIKALTPRVEAIARFKQHADLFL
ncbi:dimethylaniline monooxygenase [Cladophialophora carrionii]|uniref:Dimethylaniline monooxygenase n=1 Tax=Cladophialophora carrionii TaxID=86049 RepID=A0A1C1CLJ8_9EURO|nr:dimethylaniline monooxygenase [Cladophialophora carrionii]